jgi:hypothetical protein
MGRSIGWILVSLVLWAPPLLAAEAPRIDVSYQKQSLSVNVSDAPLDTVLVEISRQTGLDISLETKLVKSFSEEKVTAEFKDLALEDGLRRLLGPRNMMLLYDAAGLTEARIYIDGTGGFRSIKPPAPAPKARAQMPVMARKMTDAERARALARERQRPQQQTEQTAAEKLSSTLDELSGQGDEQKAMRTALDVLERERDPEMLETALSGLLGMESIPVDPLLRFAENQANPELSIQALELLSEHGRSDPRVSELLARLQNQSSNEAIREAAQSLLEDLQTVSPPRAPEGTRAPSTRIRNQEESGVQPQPQQ